MTQQPPAKPAPTPDAESQPFFDGSSRGVLMIKRCNACQKHLHPTTEFCPECLGDDLGWVEASGKGTLHTFAVMHQNYHPAFTAELPYNVSVVELEEGPRLNTNVVGIDDDKLVVGMALEVVFEQFEGGVKLPKFQPAS